MLKNFANINYINNLGQINANVVLSHESSSLLSLHSIYFDETNPISFFGEKVNQLLQPYLGLLNGPHRLHYKSTFDLLETLKRRTSQSSLGFF